MKSSLDQLTEKERVLLASLYETDHYKVLKKLLEIERLELAKDCLNISEDRLSRIQGEANGLKKLHLTIKENHKRLNKS